jgi:peptidoglycan hydrolase-like protein with peptidoglycan-binding domain
MSILRALGAALAGAVGAGDDAPPTVDPIVVRAMLTELYLVPAGASELEVEAALRRFQARFGLEPDGVAGVETARALAKRVREVREMRELGLAA